MISIGSWTGAAFVAASAFAGLYGFSKIPRGKLIAIHFNTSGVADGFAPTHMAFLIIPLIGLAIFSLTAWQGTSEPVGRGPWGLTTVIPLAVQAALCFGQFIILNRALRG